MPYWSPDTPPERPGQMPQASTAGPAPVPGPNLTVNSGVPMPAIDPGHDPSGDVMAGSAGNGVQKHPLAAPNVNPYQTAGISPIEVHGDPDAGGRDDVSGTVAGAIANAMDRQREHQTELGNVIGDLMTFPGLTTSGAPLDPGAGPGKTDPAGGFYDPPRSY